MFFLLKIILFATKNNRLLNMLKRRSKLSHYIHQNQLNKILLYIKNIKLMQIFKNLINFKIQIQIISKKLQQAKKKSQINRLTNQKNSTELNSIQAKKTIKQISKSKSIQISTKSSKQQIINLLTNMKITLKNNNIIFALIFCLFSINLISSHTGIPDNYIQILDTNIPQPTNIEIISQTFVSLQQVTNPITIKPPKFLYPAYNIKIQNDTKGNCWIQQSVSVKNIGDYIKFKKGELGMFQEWKVQIIDGTYIFGEKRVYALLTNGSILLSDMDTQVEKLNQLTKYTIYDYQASSSNQIWELDEYDLHSSGLRLYLKKQRQLFMVKFVQNLKWVMQPVVQGQNIVTIAKHKDSFYIIKNQGIYGIQQIQNRISYKSLVDFKSFNQDGANTDIIDAYVDGEYIYVLCRINGIFLIDINKNYQIIGKYPIDFSGSAHKITAKSGTVLINYRFYRKNFIAQLFFHNLNLNNSKPTLKLNKFYYRFDQMTQIVMFDKYGIIYSLSEMNLFQHSLNRYSPFGQRETELLYRAYYPKILDIISLDSSSIKYLLIEKNGIFVESIGDQSKTSGINDFSVKCLYYQPGVKQISIQFEGPCNSTTLSFCSKRNNYTFDVSNFQAVRKSQKFNNHAFIILILLAILVLVIGAVLTYRRITQQRRQKLMALLQRRAASLNQIVSMNGPSMISEQKKNEPKVLQQKQFQQ